MDSSKTSAQPLTKFDTGKFLPKLVYTFQLLLQSDSINSYCTCFSVCLKVFSDVRGLSTVNKLFADINMIVFLIFTQQM
jgi:hypothetical protein